MVMTIEELSSIDAARSCLEHVMDPEIPALSIVDMGMVGGLWFEDGNIDVDLLPTYTGCPALAAIEKEIVTTLRASGFERVRVHVKNSPAWTTDFLGPEARRKLTQSGIAPPCGSAPVDPSPFTTPERHPECPYCGASKTTLVSEFGSTACKSLHHCHACHQPFEHFKCF